MLGLLAGLHRTEIGMLENGERLPRIDTVVKLATALEIPVDQLVDGADLGVAAADRRGRPVQSQPILSAPPSDH